MSKFRGMFKTAAKENLAYKFDMMLTVILAPISIIIFYFLWKAIFLNNATGIIGGLTFEQIITYYVLTWLIAILTWTDIGDIISYDVKNGNITKNLILPISYLTHCFVYNLGSRFISLFVEAAPIVILSFIFFNIQIELASLPFFILSTILALLLNFLMTAVFALSAFWMTNNRGILKLKRVFVHFLSGAVLPLSFFPLAYQKISFYLPFQYLEYTPIGFWLGLYEGNQTFIMLGMQVVWVIIFYILCLLIWRRAITKAVSVGI